jgi:hypothetical protein
MRNGYVALSSCIISYYLLGESLQTHLREAQEQIAAHSARFDDLRNSLSEEDSTVSTYYHLCLALTHETELD